MPYKYENNQITFSGKMQDWVVHIRYWFKHDSPQLPQYDLTVYIGNITFILARYALLKWEKEILNKQKFIKLDSMIEQKPGGGVSGEFLDILNYLSENLDIADLNNWQLECRKELKSYSQVKR